VNLLASSVHFGREPNRKRVCGSLNRTRQNHYGSEPNRTKPGTVEITPLSMSCFSADSLLWHLNYTSSACTLITEWL